VVFENISNIFKVLRLNITYVQKYLIKPTSRNEIKKLNYDVIRKGLKSIDMDRSINYKFFGGFFFNWTMQGRCSYQLDPATSIQGQIYAVYCGFEKRYRFADCLKCHSSISFFKWMDGLIDFIFVPIVVVLKVREAFCPRRRPHSGPIEL